MLVESRGRLKGACVEGESAGASAPRGHLGPFDNIGAALHLLTRREDEKLSSVSAGHKSPLRIRGAN